MRDARDKWQLDAAAADRALQQERETRARAESRLNEDLRAAQADLDDTRVKVGSFRALFGYWSWYLGCRFTVAQVQDGVERKSVLEAEISRLEGKLLHVRFSSCFTALDRRRAAEGLHQGRHRHRRGR